MNRQIEISNAREAAGLSLRKKPAKSGNKLFWYSEKDGLHKRESPSRMLWADGTEVTPVTCFVEINGKRLEFTEQKSDWDPISKWDDLVFLGEAPRSACTYLPMTPPGGQLERGVRL